MKIEKDEYDLPEYDQVMDQYGKFHEDIKAGRIVASYALDANGLAAAVSKMAFGNGLGVKIEHYCGSREISLRKASAASWQKFRPRRSVNWPSPIR